MRLTYKVISKDRKERELEKLFCESMKKTIISYVYKNINKEKLRVHEDLLLSTTAIRWINKPKHLNMMNVLDILLNNIECLKVRKTHTYIIKFKDTYFPNTYNTIDSIVRFIDKGNEDYPAMYTFSNIFNMFENSINLYWRTFVMQVLHRYPIGKVLLLR